MWPTAEPEPSKKARRLDNADFEKIRREERKKSDDYYQKQLEDQKKQYQNEIRKTKKKQWCAVCSKEARYFCCSTGFYCTPECQRSHWTMGHSDVCKKRSAQPNGQHKSPITPAQTWLMLSIHLFVISRFFPVHVPPPPYTT